MNVTQYRKEIEELLRAPRIGRQRLTDKLVDVVKRAQREEADVVSRQHASRINDLIDAFQRNVNETK